MSKKLSFRKDINGLRAWAALAVLLFHFQLLHFSGGFAGVDVFFVISGYLMAAILYPQVYQNNLNLFAFYNSRIRRVAPALIALVFILFVFGCFFLIRLDFNELLTESRYAATFRYNLKYSDFDYFGRSVNEHWLMHTWTLGIEFQFYILFPVILFAINKITKIKKQVVNILLAISIVSFLAMLYKLSVSPQKAFFLLQYRIWEFLAGSILFIYQYKLEENNYNLLINRFLKIILSFFGWGILIFFFLFVKENNSWPDYRSIFPVLATLLIIAPGKDTFLTKNIIAQKIGKASYSIYLWHWPVYVGFILFGLDNIYQLCCAAILSILLGFFSYYFFERPNFIGRLSIIKQLFLMVLLIISVDKFLQLVSNEKIKLPIENQSIHMEKYFEYSTEKGRMCLDNAELCLFGVDNEKPSFILLGDSHAGSIVSGLEKIAFDKKKSFLLFASHGCAIITGIKSDDKNYEKCLRLNESINKIISSNPNVKIVILNRYNEYLLGHNEKDDFIISPLYINKKTDINNAELVNLVRSELAQGFFTTTCRLSENNSVYWVKPIPEMGVNVPNELIRAKFYHNSDISIRVSKKDYLDRNNKILQLQEKSEKNCKVKLIDPTTILCDQDWCYSSDKDNILYKDDDHLNPWGAAKIAPLFEELFN